MRNTQDFLQYGHILSNKSVASEVPKTRIDEYLKQLGKTKIISKMELKHAEKLKIKFKQL